MSHCTFVHLVKTYDNKKAFFLRHAARLPSSTSQLVWSGPWLGGGVLFHYHFRGVLFHHHFQGVLFHYHFWGLGGSSSTTTSGGGGPLPPPLPGGSSSTTTSGGFPCDLSHNAPSASWAKFTWDHPPPNQSWTNMTENITFPYTTYAGGKNIKLFYLSSMFNSMMSF